MSTKQSKSKLTERNLSEITRRYDQNELVVSQAYGDGGVDPLWARFERSVINQMGYGEATVSRYAIWANTVRDNIIEGMAAMEEGDQARARHHLIRAANSLSAFSDVQAYFDPCKLGKEA